MQYKTIYQQDGVWYRMTNVGEIYHSVQSLSRVQLCYPMDCSTLGLRVHHQLLELVQTHVHWVGDTINHLILCHPLPLPFPASGSFPMSQFFASGGQSIGVSASASVLPANNQDWFPLGWTGLICLQFKGLSRVFFKITDQKHQSFGTQLSYSPTLTFLHDYQKNHSPD